MPGEERIKQWLSTVKLFSVPCGPSIIEKAFHLDLSQLHFTFFTHKPPLLSHANIFCTLTSTSVLSMRSVTSQRCIVMVKVQFSRLTVKLVSHKCHLWFGRRRCNGYICLTGRWEVVESDGGMEGKAARGGREGVDEVVKWRNVGRSQR